MRSDGKGRRAIIERLREGPLPSRQASSVTTSSRTLRVHIHKLREAGFIIELEPEPDAPRTGSRQWMQYVLKSEPEPKGLS